MEKSYLIDQYVNKKRTCNEIGREVKKDPKTVWSWLKKHNIPTRPRGGSSSSGSFKKGTTLWKGRKHKEETKEKIRMARLKDGHVPYLKNGQHWLKQVHKSDHPKWKGGITPERQSLYSSKKWAKCIREVWSRDESTCQNCGKNYTTNEKKGTFHIHHIVPFKVKEKRDDVNNLVLLCRKCHLWVHSSKNTNKKFLSYE